MSSYTMELREYIEMFTQEQEDLTVSQKIEEGRTKLFDFTYPIFDENYRKVFETHFIRNFYMREIGFETEGLFKFYLENWLNINMPYFNKIFQSELLQFDPLTNSKTDTTSTNTKTLTETQSGLINGTNTTDNTANNTVTNTKDLILTEGKFDRQIQSDNPDTRLTLTANDGVGVIEYASKINEDSGNNTKTETGTDTVGSVIDESVSGSSNVNSSGMRNVTNVEDYVYNKVGKIGVQSFSKLLSEYRQVLLRVEVQIFNEMNQLFMLVY